MGGDKTYGNDYLKSMEIFDTKSQKWEEGKDMPMALYYMRALVVGNWIVIIGGAKNNNFNEDVNKDAFLYDTKHNIWTTINGGSSLTVTRKFFAAAVLERGTIVVVGGKDNDGNYLDSIESIYFQRLTGLVIGT